MWNNSFRTFRTFYFKISFAMIKFLMNRSTPSRSKFWLHLLLPMIRSWTQRKRWCHYATRQILDIFDLIHVMPSSFESLVLKWQDQRWEEASKWTRQTCCIGSNLQEKNFLDLLVKIFPDSYTSASGGSGKLDTTVCQWGDRADQDRQTVNQKHDWKYVFANFKRSSDFVGWDEMAG